MHEEPVRGWRPAGLAMAIALFLCASRGLQTLEQRFSFPQSSEALAATPALESQIPSTIVIFPQGRMPETAAPIDRPVDPDGNKAVVALSPAPGEAAGSTPQNEPAPSEAPLANESPGLQMEETAESPAGEGEESAAGQEAKKEQAAANSAPAQSDVGEQKSPTVREAGMRAAKKSAPSAKRKSVSKKAPAAPAATAAAAAKPKKQKAKQKAAASAVQTQETVVEASAVEGPEEFKDELRWFSVRTGFSENPEAVRRLAASLQSGGFPGSKVVQGDASLFYVEAGLFVQPQQAAYAQARLAQLGHRAAIVEK